MGIKALKSQHLKIDFHICSTKEISDKVSFSLQAYCCHFSEYLSQVSMLLIHLQRQQQTSYPQYMPIIQFIWQTRNSKNSNNQLSQAKDLTKHEFTNVKNVGKQIAKADLIAIAYK